MATWRVGGHGVWRGTGGVCGCSAVWRAPVVLPGVVVSGALAKPHAHRVVAYGYCDADALGSTHSCNVTGYMTESRNQGVGKVTVIVGYWGVCRNG